MLVRILETICLLIKEMELLLNGTKVIITVFFIPINLIKKITH